ncbi:MAG: type IV pilus modification protein PilV [Neisseriaceae bacterium]|nr:type IV pilus modification protein PilV [Neisseriaceae bacterium]
MKTAATSSIHQQGSTLIEILVSMFILALGLMALIAMQTRTSIGIKEAENQTIIAQATENLAENMMTNPYLDSATAAQPRSYGVYTSDFACEKNANPVRPQGTTAGQVGREALATYHLADFYSTACEVVGVDGDVAVTIKNNAVGSNAATGQTLSVTWKVSGSSDKTFTYDYPLDDNL